MLNAGSPTCAWKRERERGKWQPRIIYRKLPFREASICSTFCICVLISEMSFYVHFLSKGRSYFPPPCLSLSSTGRVLPCKHSLPLISTKCKPTHHDSIDAPICSASNLKKHVYTTRGLFINDPYSIYHIFWVFNASIIETNAIAIFPQGAPLAMLIKTFWADIHQALHSQLPLLAELFVWFVSLVSYYYYFFLRNLFQSTRLYNKGIIRVDQQLSAW